MPNSATVIGSGICALPIANAIGLDSVSDVMALVGEKSTSPSGSLSARLSGVAANSADWPVLAVTVSRSGPTSNASRIANGIRMSFLTACENVIVRLSVPKKLLSSSAVENVSRPVVSWTWNPLPTGDVNVAVLPPDVIANVGVAPSEPPRSKMVVAWAPVASARERDGGEQLEAKRHGFSRGGSR